MDPNTAMFLITAITATSIFMVTFIVLKHQRRLKELEVEKLRVERVNLRKEVDEAVAEKFANHAGRIEVLEAIVTDKNYDLSDKITRLK